MRSPARRARRHARAQQRGGTPAGGPGPRPGGQGWGGLHRPQRRAGEVAGLVRRQLPGPGRLRQGRVADGALGRRHQGGGPAAAQPALRRQRDGRPADRRRLPAHALDGPAAPLQRLVLPPRRQPQGLQARGLHLDARPLHREPRAERLRRGRGAAAHRPGRAGLPLRRGPLARHLRHGLLQAALRRAALRRDAGLLRAPREPPARHGLRRRGGRRPLRRGHPGRGHAAARVGHWRRRRLHDARQGRGPGAQADARLGLPAPGLQLQAEGEVLRPAVPHPRPPLPRRELHRLLHRPGDLAGPGHGGDHPTAHHAHAAEQPLRHPAQDARPHVAHGLPPHLALLLRLHGRGVRVRAAAAQPRAQARGQPQAAERGQGRGRGPRPGRRGPEDDGHGAPHALLRDGRRGAGRPQAQEVEVQPLRALRLSGAGAAPPQALHGRGGGRRDGGEPGRHRVRPEHLRKVRPRQLGQPELRRDPQGPELLQHLPHGPELRDGDVHVHARQGRDDAQRRVVGADAVWHLLGAPH
mmetsp:Transcript_75970/g.246032  ORF Transcript_75970/g.246032 Transcript_75970/m.246032 type:complete len:525 (-) Transcript_75970:244-1818(-)